MVDSIGPLKKEIEKLCWRWPHQSMPRIDYDKQEILREEIQRQLCGNEKKHRLHRAIHVICPCFNLDDDERAKRVHVIIDIITARLALATHEDTPEERINLQALISAFMEVVKDD